MKTETPPANLTSETRPRISGAAAMAESIKIVLDDSAADGYISSLYDSCMKRMDRWDRAVPASLLSDCCTLKDIAPLFGTYATAYSWAAGGAFGDPVAIVGKTRLFSRAAVDAALARRAAGKGKTPKHAA